MPRRHLRTTRLTFLLAALAPLLMLGCTQQAAVQSVSDVGGARGAPLEQSLLMTTALRAGTLDNGMRYYVRENGEPENRAFLRAGPSAREVADVQAAMLREHETNMRQNAYWLAALAASYQYEADPGARNLLDYGPMIETMTPEVIREGMARYLDPDHYVRVTLMPER